MKKIVFTTLLAFASTSAFAGFNGNANNNQGGFQAKNATTQAMSVKQALSAADNSVVTLVGNITQQIDNDDYLFTDGTASIRVEINNRVWNGLNVNEKDKIRITGKLNNEAFEKAEVEVFSVEKAN